MIFTVARIQGETLIEFDRLAQALSVKYRNPHRASGGKLLEVRFERYALVALVREMHRLEIVEGNLVDPASLEAACSS